MKANWLPQTQAEANQQPQIAYVVRFELDGVERQETVEAHSREEARFLVRHFWGRAAKLLKTPERIENGNP